MDILEKRLNYNTSLPKTTRIKHIPVLTTELRVHRKIGVALLLKRLLDVKREEGAQEVIKNNGILFNKNFHREVLRIPANFMFFLLSSMNFASVRIWVTIG